MSVHVAVYPECIDHALYFCYFDQVHRQCQVEGYTAGGRGGGTTSKTTKTVTAAYNKQHDVLL